MEVYKFNILADVSKTDHLLLSRLELIQFFNERKIPLITTIIYEG